MQKEKLVNIMGACCTFMKEIEDQKMRKRIKKKKKNEEVRQ